MVLYYLASTAQKQSWNKSELSFPVNVQKICWETLCRVCCREGWRAVPLNFGERARTRVCVLALDPGLFGVARKEEHEWTLAD